jgi:hypothetical protein
MHEAVGSKQAQSRGTMNRLDHSHAFVASARRHFPRLALRTFGKLRATDNGITGGRAQCSMLTASVVFDF